jgi:hypothetical protein
MAADQCLRSACPLWLLDSPDETCRNELPEYFTQSSVQTSGSSRARRALLSPRITHRMCAILATLRGCARAVSYWQHTQRVAVRRSSRSQIARRVCASACGERLPVCPC